MKIKVCGMRNTENISQLIELCPDYMGFIFYPKSKRFVGDNFDKKITAQIPHQIKKTGVFVNATVQYIKSRIEKYQLDAVQLHGNESPFYCKKILQTGVELIKVFSIDNSFDMQHLQGYEDVCNCFLFDTATLQYGGSGKKFNWQLLKNYSMQKPFFLSGGISVNDAEIIKNIPYNIYGIDLNSRFENKPALKNISLLSRFFEKIRN